MSVQYVKNQKGRDQLLYKGYLHRKGRASAGKVLWKCADPHKRRCTGRVHTRDGQVVKYFPHRHPPDETAGKTKRRPCGPKDTAAGQESTRAVAVPPNSETSLGAAAKKKPCNQNNPKQTIQRLRACLNALRQSTSGLRTPTPAKAAAEEPHSALPQASAVWIESPREETVEEICKADPIPREETSTCHPSLSWAHQEAGRLMFRTSPVPPGKTPQEVLSRLSEAAQQWLCPQEHSKEQIVDMVILEQFLDVLPVDMRTWVRAREPDSSKEAARLAESYFKEQPPDHTVQDQITFEDVSVGFTTDEWALLSHREKTLYWNVMYQNYDNVACLAGGGPDGKSEEVYSWQQTAEPMVEMSEKHEALSPSLKQDIIRENCLEKPQKNSPGKEGHFLYFREALRKLVRGTDHPDTELRQESWCLSTDCEKQSESTVFLDTQKGPIEEDPELLILPGELLELSEQKNLQNPEHNSVNEGQNSMERQNSNYLERKEDKSVLLKKWLWDPFLQDLRPGEETLHIVIDSAQQNKSLNCVSNAKIHNGRQADCVVLPEESLEMSEEEISQNPVQDLLPDPVHISSKLSPTELNEISGLTSEKQKENSVKNHQASSTGSEKHQEKPILFRNTSEELAKDMFHPVGQLGPEIQHTCIDQGDQEEMSEHVDNQKTSCGEDVSLKREKLLSQNLEELSCSESGENSNGLSISTKRKKNKEKEKYFNRRSTCVKSVLGAHERIRARRKSQKHLNWENQNCYRPCSCRLLEGEKGLTETPHYYPLKPHIQTCEALHLPIKTAKISSEVDTFSPDPKGLPSQQRSSSPPLLNNVDAEPSLAQLIGVLQQVAADTAEIKSAVSSLHATITGIQNALGSLSGCTDEAEHRISNLEDTSRNTKAQLVQHCSDIKAIEAKLGGKSVQTNVIAGLWSSLKITRGASPLNLSPNS